MNHNHLYKIERQTSILQMLWRAVNYSHQRLQGETPLLLYFFLLYVYR